MRITNKKIIHKLQYFDAVFNNMPAPIITIDNNGEINFINKSGCDIFDYNKTELIGKNINTLLKEQLFDKNKEIKSSETINRNQPQQQKLEIIAIKKNKEEFTVQIAINKMTFNDQLIYILSIHDITQDKKFEKSLKEKQEDIEKKNVELENARKVALSIMQDTNIQKKRTQEALLELEKSTEEIRKLSEAIKQSHSSVLIADTKGNIEFVNNAFLNITGYSREEVINQNPRILKSGLHNKKYYKDLWETIISGNVWTGEFANRKKNGEIFWESAVISPIKKDNNEITHFLAVKENITERKKNQKELEARANRLTKHNLVLQKLTQENDFTLNLESAYKAITKSATAGLGISRSGIWLYNLDMSAIKCVNLYEANIKKYSSGSVIKKEEFPIYFSSLTKEYILTINDARTDSRTSEFYELYYKPLNIYSTLDIPIWYRGKVIGVLCNEQDGKKRIWEADEELFGRSLADFIALAIETDERKKAQEAAESATQAKSEFLANMSHEIRTPMNAIIGFSEILRKRIKDPLNKEYLESIKTSSKTLLSLINDVLDFSKIEAGKLELQLNKVNIRYLIKEIQNIFTFKTQEKDLQLIYTIPDEFPHNLLLDELRIKQVLLNFINNAIKFTLKGSITIQLSFIAKGSKKSDITFSVIDTGIGIPNKEHKKIFEAFQQKEQQDTRKFGGTGLGLAISSQLVNLMGGYVELKSKPNVGSTFSFTIPNVKIVEGNTEQFEEITNTENIVFKKANILVVDDLENNREVISGLLSDHAFNIIEAESGQQALEIVEKEKPDLILLDIRMPKMDGYKTLSALRKIKSINKIPVIALTASTFNLAVQKINKSGFDGFIPKPFELHELINTLARFLPYKRNKGIQTNENLKSNKKEIVIHNKNLIEELKTDCIPLINEIDKIPSTSIIKNLGENIVNTANIHEHKDLEEKGKELLLAVNSFNIEKIENLLNDFKTLLTNLEKTE